MTFPKQVIENTLVDYPRLEKLAEFLLEAKQTNGCLAEVGVYKGGTAYLISESEKVWPIFLFDTFEGMPEVSDKDLHKTGDFNNTSIEYVGNLLRHRPNVYLIKGKFPDSVTMFCARKLFSFVHIDCDIYQSVKDSLEFFYPRMNPGGVIVLDDYDEPHCPGAKLATDEFLADKQEKIFSRCQSQVAIRKR